MTPRRKILPAAPAAARNSSLQKTALGAGAIVLAALILGACLTLMAGMISSNDGLVYLAAAFLASAIPLTVGVTRGKDFDPFEPINLVAFAIFFGTTIRAPWLMFSDSSRADFLMMGTTFAQVSRNSPAILLSITALTLGYALARGRFRLERLEWVRSYRFDRQRLWFGIWLFALTSLFGTYLFMKSFGIDFSEGILSQSMKRFQAIAGDDGDVYGAGYERYLALLSQHALILACGLMIVGVVKFRQHALVITLLGFLSVLIPFLASSRTVLFVLAVNIFVIAYYFGKLKIWRLILFAVLAAQMFAFLGALRESNQVRRDFDEVDSSIATRVLGSGNSLDFVRTSAIIDRVPSVVDFEYGKTYAALASAYVPRAWWPEKPAVSLGPFVKDKIFGARTKLSGWPSGMIAEGWLNFGFVGLLIPMFLFGMLLRVIYESFKPSLGVSVPLTILYSVSVWRLGVGTIGVNFAHGLTQTINFFAPMLILLIIARAPTRKKAAARRPATA